MKQHILYLITAVLLFSLAGLEVVMAQTDYQEVTIRELNTYDELPQTTSDFPDHPMVGEPVEFTAIVLTNPKSSGLSNFTPEDEQNEGDVGISRIHFFVIDTTAYHEGKEGMYMQVVAGDVEAFESLERGDLVTMRGTHDFYQSVVQFNPDDSNWRTNILMGGEDNPFSYLQELLEPITLSAGDINEIVDEDGPTFRFRPEAYPDYINAYVRMEGHEVIGSERADTDRPNMYWIDESGVGMQYRDISLRYRNDRNDEQGGYREGYNFRRVDEDGPFRPPSSGSIINISGFVVWDTFDGAFGINESTEEGALQLAPMEDGVLWWLGERTFVDPNSGEPWPDDLEILGFPPVISNQVLSDSIPDAGEAVTVSAEITGPEGEDVDEVTLTYYTNRGETGTQPMVDEGGGVFSFEFPVFDEFTAVEFVINATSEAELVSGDIKEITATFSDGDLDVAGEELEMTFVYLGDEITDIATIQRTMDGTRGPSPFEEFEGLGLNFDAVVVSGAEDGFVVVHDGNEAWSGVPLASAGDVTELDRGESITITGGEISSSFDNVFLNDVTFTTNGSVDNLDDYIPVITTSQARENDGRAYEGMMIRLENVEVQSAQADAPGNDYGEWLLKPQNDPEGRVLRVRNRLSFADITEGLESRIPFDLNAHMKVGAGFDAVYGFMSHSFGNPKLQLRTVDDLVTDESFTWPVRNIDLTGITTLATDSPVAGQQDTIRTDEDNIAEWDSTGSYDGDTVTYRFALTHADGNFEDPLLSLPGAEEGALPEVTISSEQLMAAVEDHLPADTSGVFKWTVFLNDGDGEVQVSEKDGPDFIPYAQDVHIHGSQFTSADEVADIPQTVELRQNYPNPFNPSTVIEYTVPNDTQVRLTVYDVLGRRVNTLVNEHHTAGSYSVNFDAARLASGVYIYRLEAGDVMRTRRMMLVK